MICHHRVAEPKGEASGGGVIVRNLKQPDYSPPLASALVKVAISSARRCG